MPYRSRSRRPIKKIATAIGAQKTVTASMVPRYDSAFLFGHELRRLVGAHSAILFV
jgi:hypothetical protein